MVYGVLSVASGSILSACTGQTPTQKPQPVQRSPSMRGLAMPPTCSANRIARSSQASPQERHSTLRWAKQVSRISTRSLQGGSRSGSNARAVQAVAQSLHSVQPRCWKSTSGNPPEPERMIPSGQIRIQSEQRVQRFENSRSGSAHGGRMTSEMPEKLPRNSCLRDGFMARIRKIKFTKTRMYSLELEIDQCKRERIALLDLAQLGPAFTP